MVSFKLDLMPISIIAGLRFLLRLATLLRLPNRLPGALAAILLATSHCAAIAQIGPDPALFGCWRAQQSEHRYADGRVTELNQDCVTLINSKTIQSSCYFSKGPYQTVSTYVAAGPGKLNVKSVASTDGPVSSAEVRPLEYSIIDGRWLITTVRPALAGDTTPASISGVLIRLKDKDPNDRCAPSGRTDPWQRGVSSFKLSAPARFAVMELDPAADPTLQQGIGNELVIGFFRRSDQPSAGTPLTTTMADTVKVTEQLNFGAKPVTTSDFDTIKQRARAQLTPEEIWCDTPQRLCVELRVANPDDASKQQLIAIAFVLLRGRMVVITARGADLAMPSQLFTHHAADAFSNQLIADNP